MLEMHHETLCKVFDIHNIGEWSDKNRFDRLIIEKLRSIPGFAEVIATKEDAEFLFFMLLDRYKAGSERAGRTYDDILSELINSEEYILKKLTYATKTDHEVTINGRHGKIVIKKSDGGSFGQGVYSCFVEYVNGDLYMSFPQNFCEKTYSSRFIPYLRVFHKALEILAGSSTINRGVYFFYGDHPTRDFGVAFCSNKLDDYLVPDPDVMQIFKNPPELKCLWSDRLPIAYFRGTDTGSAFYKNFENSQRIALSILSKNSSELIDAKITGAENKNNIDLLKSMGIWGEREPQENIQLYKYNVDVDGNSNSWAGLVNKLLMGAGGVVLKARSPESYRQWFYNRLEPWINFVPVEADLSDICEKITYLKSHDSIAENIHKNASHIFHGLDYEYLANYAAHVFVLSLQGIKTNQRPAF